MEKAQEETGLAPTFWFWLPHMVNNGRETAAEVQKLTNTNHVTKEDRQASSIPATHETTSRELVQGLATLRAAW